MKSNWIKYVFIIFIIGILIFAVLKIRQDQEEINLEEQSTSNEDEQVKEIKVGIVGLDTINPILSNNKNVQDINKLIYEPLVNLSSDYKAEPCLATEWAKESNNSYLVKLRENVRWSDGQRFTSEDVRFTIDRLKEISSIYSYNVQYVIGIDVLDDYTVRINLDGEVTFFGLDPDKTYYVEETKAPEGYSRLTEIWKLEGASEQTTGPVVSDTGTDDNDIPYTVMTTTTTVTDYTTMSIPNTKLSSLPSTGGIGTTIFTIGGCVIMVTAAGLYFATRKKEQN